MKEELSSRYGESSSCKLRNNWSVADAIARQEADKKRLSGVIKRPTATRAIRKAITKDDVSTAVRSALEDVARDLRFKAKETPAWAAAYHSACAVIEKRMPK